MVSRCRSINDTFSLLGELAFIEYFRPLIATAGPGLKLALIQSLAKSDKETDSAKPPFAFHLCKQIDQPLVRPID
jgi:hypothetical protein